GAGGRVRIAEIHLQRVGVGIARVGPLVVGIRPLGRVRVRRRLVQDMVGVPLWSGVALGHVYSSLMWSQQGTPSGSSGRREGVHAANDVVIRCCSAPRLGLTGVGARRLTPWTIRTGMERWCRT